MIANFTGYRCRSLATWRGVAGLACFLVAWLGGTSASNAACSSYVSVAHPSAAAIANGVGDAAMVAHDPASPGCRENDSGGGPLISSVTAPSDDLSPVSLSGCAFLHAQSRGFVSSSTLLSALPDDAAVPPPR